MKRAKRSFELEENELDYSKELGIELEDDLDEEVIDLEDIVELPDDSEDDDLSLDVELLDVDSDLDLSDMDAKLKGSGSNDVLDDDLLKEFSFGESDEKAPEAPPKQDNDILGQGSVDDLLKDFSFSEDADSPFGAASERGSLEDDSKDSDFESLMDLDKGLFSEPEIEPPPKVAEKPRIVAPIPVAPPVAAEAFEAGAPGLDEFVIRIEARLEEKIREIIESRLPDIVRNILREEIEKLKREF